MDDPQTVALCKAIPAAAAAKARRGLAPGRHEIDVTVRLRGELLVGEDTDKTPTASVPLLETLALFVHYSGITGGHATALLKRAMTDALAAGNSGVGAVADALPVVRRVQEEVVRPMLDALPRTRVAGQVRAKLDVQEVAAASAERPAAAA